MTEVVTKIVSTLYSKMRTFLLSVLISCFKSVSKCSWLNYPLILKHADLSTTKSWFRCLIEPSSTSSLCVVSGEESHFSWQSWLYGRAETPLAPEFCIILPLLSIVKRLTFRSLKFKINFVFSKTSFCLPSHLPFYSFASFHFEKWKLLPKSMLLDESQWQALVMNHV